MQLIWRATVLGLAAFALALLVVLPASWVAGLLPAHLQCASLRGSIWRGQCAGLQWSGGGTEQKIDLLRWQLRPLALFTLTLRADLQLRGDLGEAAGQLELGRGGRIDLRLQVPCLTVA
jgi:Type II secretion system (T2SS), protein N